MGRTRRFLLLLPLLAAVLAAGCAVFSDGCKHYVDLYVDGKARLVTLDADTPIPTLLLFKGDVVIFNNLTDDKVTITVPKDVFGEETVVVPANGRVMLEVIAPSFDGKVTKVSAKDIFIEGLPTLKVGEGP